MKCQFFPFFGVLFAFVGLTSLNATGESAVVDRKKRVVVAKGGLGVQFGNYPMALDDTHKRLFVGCRLPAKLVVLDTTSGRIVSRLLTIGDGDDVFYDADRRLVYVSGGEGAVEVLRQRDPDRYEPDGKITTAPGARTGLFVAALFAGMPTG